jgi:hypothetical protein
MLDRRVADWTTPAGVRPLLRAYCQPEDVATAAAQ